MSGNSDKFLSTEAEYYDVLEAWKKYGNSLQSGEYSLTWFVYACANEC